MKVVNNNIIRLKKSGDESAIKELEKPLTELNDSQNEEIEKYGREINKLKDTKFRF